MRYRRVSLFLLKDVLFNFGVVLFQVFDYNCNYWKPLDKWLYLSSVLSYEEIFTKGISYEKNDCNFGFGRFVLSSFG